jgi:Tfp pilus assembly protein PilF/4-amino-4-deoxy-L-arabinose transferase-like glycosyltransferase
MKIKGLDSFSKLELRFIIFIFALSLGLRFCYLSIMSQSPFFTHPSVDALYHDVWAQAIASGEILGDKIFFRAPLYPYWLGAIYTIFGHNYFIPCLVQHTVGAFVVLIVYFLSRRVFNKSTAVIASLFISCYGVIIYFENKLLFDSLLVFLSLSFVAILYWTKISPSKYRWFLTGLILGLVCITRPIFLPYIFIIIVYQLIVYLRFLGIRTTLMFIFAFCIGVSILILPVTLRNYFVGNDFVLIASQGGINFYIGNNPSANGYSSFVPEVGGETWENREVEFIAKKEIGLSAKPSDISNYWYSRGWKFIRSQPKEFLQLTFKKMYLFWNKLEIPNNQSFYSSWLYSSFLRWLPFGFWLIGPLGLLGMFIAWQSNRGRFMVVVVLFYMFIVILFFVCDRFRLPVVPLLCIFSGYAIVCIYEKIKFNLYKSVFIYGIAFILLTALSNSNIYNLNVDNEARDLFCLGNVKLGDEHYDEAIKYYKQSLSTHSVEPYVFLNWGVALLLSGKTDEAIQKFRDELKWYPHSYRAYTNLAYAFHLKGELDSIILFGNRAIQEKPYVPYSYALVAQGYLRLNDFTAAESTLAKGANICGRDFTFGEYLLAGIHLKQNKIQLAETEYREALDDLVLETQPCCEPEFNYSLENKIGESPKILCAKLHYGLGFVFILRNNLDSALTYFSKSVLIDRDYADAWADLAITYHKLNLLAEADSAFLQAVKLEPNNYRYLYSYGLLLGAMKRYLEAQNLFERTLQINPNYLPAREILNRMKKERNSK